MSEQELDNVIDVQEAEQLDEFKADHSDAGAGKGAEVPEPTATKAAKRSADKDQGEKTPPKLPGTRLGMVNAMMNVMSGMNKTQLSAAMKKMTETSNMNSIKVKGDAKSVTMEDMEDIFGGKELSEEFKEKTATLFEAAVGARVEEEKIRLQEELDAQYEADLAEAKSELDAKADDYLSYVAEQWMKENEVAIESGIRTQIAESFIEGLKGLFVEHNIDIPEDKVDVIDEMNTKTEDLEAKLEEQMATNMELSKELSEMKRNQVLADISEDLTLAQKEKLTALASGISYDDLEEFESKLGVVKENYFPSVKSEEVSYDEEIETDDENTVKHDPTVARYMDAISRTSKK